MNRTNRRTEKKGVTVIITVALLGVIIPMVGLGIDASLMYAIKAKLQAAADAASLAGARSLNRGMDLPSQAGNAQATALTFFNANFPNGHMRTTGPHIDGDSGGERLQDTHRSLGCQRGWPDILHAVARVRLHHSQGQQHGVAPGRQHGPRAGPVFFHERSDDRHAGRGPRNLSDRFAEGRDNVGLMVFGGSSVTAFPNPSPYGPVSNFKSASPNVDTLISQTVNGGNTGTAQALWLAYQELVKRNEPGALNLIVFFTDGLPNGLTGEFNDPNSTKNLLKTTSGCTYRRVAGRPMPGFLSQKSNFAPTGTTAGIKILGAGSVSSVSEGPIQTNSNGCAYRSNEDNMPQDVLKMPALDLYGNSTTGYHTVNLNSVTSPQQIGYASLNAADSAVQRIRQDNSLNVVIYTIGYNGGSEQPDEVWMKRISNDPTSSYYTTSEPPGLYVQAASTGDLSAAFAKVASEILRLAL